MVNRVVQRSQQLIALQRRDYSRYHAMIAIGVMMILNLPVTSQQHMVYHLGQNGGAGGSGDPKTFSGEVTGDLVRFIVEAYFKRCHVLLAEEGSSTISRGIMRSLQEAYIPQVILDLKSVTFDPKDDLIRALRRRGEKVTCSLFIFDLTNSGDDASMILEFMEKLRLFMVRYASVVFVGFRPLLQEILRSKSLWNTARVLYLVVQMIDDPSTHLQKNGQPSPVTIYSRCLFCNKGESGIQLIDRWNAKSGFLWGNTLLQDEFKNLLGHRLRVVQKKLYPFATFTEDERQNSTKVTPQDSIEVRALRAVAQALNFTYEMRIPWDNQWGTSTDSGNWTGMVGTIQHHKADFAMTLKYLRSRMKVMDYTMGYIRMPLVLIMATPPPPSPYLAIIRPFPVDIWTYVIVSIVLAGFIMWTLQYVWTKVSKEPGMGLDKSIMSTFSTIFEEPAHTMPTNTSGLIFMGWWWIYCTLITVVYKSTLVSHLSVPLTSSTIDTLDQLLAAGGWTWGFKFKHSSDYEWFKAHEDPVVKKIFQGLEIMNTGEQVKRMMSGKHAVLDNPIVFMSNPAVISAINFGRSPFHFGKEEYNTGGIGWGFRRNAPFKPAIDLKIHKLVEAGLVTKWVSDLSGTMEKKNVKDNAVQRSDQAVNVQQDDSDQVVLSLNHLQSVFYVLVMGFFVASLAFFGEMMRASYS